MNAAAGPIVFIADQAAQVRRALVHVICIGVETRPF